MEWHACLDLNNIQRLRSFHRHISLSYGVILLASTFHLASGTVGVRWVGFEVFSTIKMCFTQADSGILSLSWGKLSINVSSEYCRRCVIKVYIRTQGLKQLKYHIPQGQCWRSTVSMEASKLFVPNLTSGA